MSCIANDFYSDAAVVFSGSVPAFCLASVAYMCWWQQRQHIVHLGAFVLWSIFLLGLKFLFAYTTPLYPTNCCLIAVTTFKYTFPSWHIAALVSIATHLTRPFVIQLRQPEPDIEEHEEPVAVISTRECCLRILLVLFYVILVIWARLQLHLNGPLDITCGFLIGLMIVLTAEYAVRYLDVPVETIKAE